MSNEQICLSLPKGDLLPPIAKLISAVNFPIEGYHAENRTYRPEVKGLNIRAKIMAEKDVALQVAVGNYDIGFCGRDWIEEHSIQFKATQLHVLKQLHLADNGGGKGIFVCAGKGSTLRTVDDLKAQKGFVVIVSEYPNIAKNFAIHHNLPKFKIFTAWGSVEGYPPEHADVVILSTKTETDLYDMALQPVTRIFESRPCLVVNTQSFKTKNLTHVLRYFTQPLTQSESNQ